MTRVVLASRSAARAAMLAGAGVAHDIVDSGVDEAEIKDRLLVDDAGPRDIAGRLAEAKAATVSALRPDAIVVGADTTLELEGALIDKAETLDEARERLVALRGRWHRLHSAVAVARNGLVLWRTIESPRLRMRDVSDSFLDGYLTRCGGALLGSVGCYLLEGEGAQLFERVEGDHFAILGLPLLPLLQFLRESGTIAA